MSFLRMSIFVCHLSAHCLLQSRAKDILRLMCLLSYLLYNVKTSLKERSQRSK